MLTRRSMIQRMSAAAAGLLAGSVRSDAASPYGTLYPRRTENTGEFLLSLPDGFRYTRISATGTFMTDGNVTPPLPDGMAAFDVAFDVGGELRVICNHEVKQAAFAMSAGPWQYDAMGGGGTTTIVVDPITRLPRQHFVSLSGTAGNCSGGRTPWGTWLSCEETLGNTGHTKLHGYCFEVPASANTAVDAIPLKAMGRFVHEAAAVDPVTGIVYLTEDAEASGLYRFIPAQPGVLRAGGRLQMLAVRDAPSFDGSGGVGLGARFAVAWVDIANPDASVFAQGRARGGASFRRLEGATFGSGTLFFTSTTGGDRGFGQIWQLRVRGAHRQRALRNGSTEELSLLFESPAGEVLRLPDNICVTPQHTLMVCEDNGGTNHLRGVRDDGTIFPFARNITPGFENSELTGVCFSPDGATLFVNIQLAGATLAIWGPWKA
jgi:secreted PhoX family phosphatase